MADNKNLQDDMLKTVRYWIAFEKPNYEAVLHEGIDIVCDNLTDTQFTAWKIAEFMQMLDKKSVAIPLSWQGKNVSFFSADSSNEFVANFDDKDKKYLTVHLEVVGRMARRRGRPEERTEALETIAESIEHGCDGELRGTAGEE